MLFMNNFAHHIGYVVVVVGGFADCYSVKLLQLLKKSWFLHSKLNTYEELFSSYSLICCCCCLGFADGDSVKLCHRWFVLLCGGIVQCVHQPRASWVTDSSLLMSSAFTTKSRWRNYVLCTRSITCFKKRTPSLNRC